MFGGVDGRIASRRVGAFRGKLWVAGVLAHLICGPTAQAENDPWPGIRAEVFHSREIVENDGFVTLFAPDSAQDASVVPVTLRIPGNVIAGAKSITLIIDRNPAPVAASIALGDGFRAGPDIGERVIATRVRIDSFSKVRAVLETDDGKLHMSSRFVAGAGGCSSLGAKDADEALANLGQFKFKSINDPNRDANWREGQVMVRHPNSTGMQMDPTTRDFRPAHFISEMEIKRGESPFLKMESGISISENTPLRFSYGSTGQDEFSVLATDNQGGRFAGKSVIPNGS
ncbi:MAG: quinoprotein dehydrogenase-associated SoxYZ-like carrier [Hyphomicrobiaceae bacterium]